MIILDGIERPKPRERAETILELIILDGIERKVRDAFSHGEPKPR